MLRRSKGLIVGFGLVLLAGLMFAGTIRNLYRGVLSPLHRVAARERSMVVEESHQLYSVRMMEITSRPLKDVEAMVSKDLVAQGYMRENYGVASEVFYAKSGIIPGGATPMSMPDIVILAVDPPDTGPIYAADLHRASSLEILAARVMTLGKKFPKMSDLGNSPKEFMDGKGQTKP